MKKDPFPISVTDTCRLKSVLRYPVESDTNDGIAFTVSS